MRLAVRLAGVLWMCGGVWGAGAQSTSPERPVPTQPGGKEVAPGAPLSSRTPGVTPPQLESGDTTIKIEKRLTKQQEDKVLADSEEIFRFASKDTGLPIQHSVKKVFVSREEVNKDLRKRFEEDKGNKRLEQSELVLKKFGLLDRDFQLRPFLLSLLTEQIAGFYDNKTKTMNLLDWVPVEEQKPVMAHELTHALQDQTVDLHKWEDIQPDGIAKNVAEDNRHIETDEADTVRDAVLEGQAMVSFADYMLKPMNKTLKDMPQMAQMMAGGSDNMADSPVLSRAPLILQQSLLFPYTSGLLFEQALLEQGGTKMAFAGALKTPPTASSEILHPELYLKHRPVPVLTLPDLHPALTAAGYEPYDVGVMGELDVRMTAELFGGKPLAEAMAPQWDGGIYYAAQRKSASEAEKKTTGSIALLYLSRWKTADAAQSFFHLFEQQLPREYDKLQRREADEKDAGERVYTTGEGDVLLGRKGTEVWVSEGFAVALARSMRESVEAVQGQGPIREARGGSPADVPKPELTAGLRRWMGSFGVLRAGLR